MPDTLHLVTEQQQPLAAYYLIARLTKHWQDDGFALSTGPLRRLERGLGLLHVNKTRVPAALVPELEPGARLLNGQVLDISKRRISAQRLEGPGDWDGPVIVKTDDNYYGLPEGRGQRPRLLRHLPWRWRRELPLDDYPVLPSARKVPGWVWQRRDLVVERFLPEREGAHYVLRQWIFFGDRGIVYRMLAESPVVKSQKVVSYEAGFEPPPPEIAEARERLGFDFGKFDYVLYEGRPVLLDANKTPAMGGKREDRMRYLADGLRSFLP